VNVVKWINSEKLENDYSCSDAIYLAEALFFNFSVVNYSVHAVYSSLLALFFSIRISQRHAIPITCPAVCCGIKKLKSDSIDIDGISKVHLSQSCLVFCFSFTITFSDVYMHI